ncbi:glucoamylase family protein [Fibrivirga algicola]|uniref:Tat pathway signal protein n=1 Tax=Fibrivirga algicola TaxID=2950420 RepID=A0ABX0QEH2_9BACT|nr:glucoamylase family protein [Fibrivirga algicola]ARK11114.1 Tat pathway signal protein [Fibrella sp. ES10-3-2-2]NID09615.1 Tat pathway signal protein [Fibrivirga algicola]
MKKLLIIFFLFPAALTVFSQSKQPTTRLSKADEAFLDSLQRDTFRFFWETANPDNGLLPDRAPSRSFSSIAAVGFGLTSYLIGAERGYVTRQQAADRTLRTLRFFAKAPQSDAATGVAGYKGFFYHFLDMKTGERFKQVELSTIDTALLLGGILSAQSYFDRKTPVETEIRQLADQIYGRADWAWFQAGRASTSRPFISMGWHPEKGFIKSDWTGYNEGMLLYVLALASPTHPVGADVWPAWTKSYPWATFHGQEHVNFDPLFGHQYSHCWIDFKGIRDDYMRAKGIDYFENSRRATYANRAYCMTNPGKWTDYSATIWGLTACDGPKDTTANGRKFFSYRARGAASTGIVDDGTIAPTAAGGSMAFAPEICIPALRAMKTRYGAKLYGQYGFRDAFNPTYRYRSSFANGSTENGWFDIDYLGIDQGPILIMAENLRTGFVWNLMKKNPHIRRGLQKAGFTGGWLN